VLAIFLEKTSILRVKWVCFYALAPRLNPRRGNPDAALVALPFAAKVPLGGSAWTRNCDPSMPRFVESRGFPRSFGFVWSIHAALDPS
jgi:hypothetical protein